MRRTGPQWAGFRYDGRTAQRESVTVTVGDGGIDLRRPDGSTIHWPFEALRQTQGSFSGERLRIEFGTDPVEVLLIHQDGLAEAIRDASPTLVRRFRPRRNTARVVAWSLGSLAVVAAAYAVGAPLVANALAPRVPVEWEVALGQSVIERIAPPERLCTDAAALADLRVILDRLVTALPAQPYEFRLRIVRDSQVNAFAAPGGFVVVNSGLVAAAATPEQFAGVLAHEIQHIVHRHSTRAVIREAPLRLALSTLSEGGGVETGAGVLGTLGALRYQRDDEAEADREGVRLLAAARVDPAEMVAFLRTLETNRHGAPRMVSYLSSHPQTADRVATLEAMVPRAGVTSSPLLDPGAWRRVRASCLAG